MRYSQIFIPTLKETPAEAEVVSHRLLLTGRFYPQTDGRGLYLSALWAGRHPQGRADRPGGDEPGRGPGAADAHGPARRSLEGVRAAGRSMARSCLRFKDRHEREVCLGPTHEEVITDLVRSECPLLPQSAAQSLSDPDQIPR